MPKQTNPHFHPGDLVITARYLPPIPAGTLVAVIGVHNVMNGGLRYSLAVPDSERTVWAYPEDIAQALLGTAPLLESAQ